MKRIYLLLIAFLFSSSVIHSQNYRMLNAGSEMFFTSNAYQYPYYLQDEVYGLKCDSTQGTIQDSSFFPYRTIIETVPNTSCNGDPSYPIWAGTGIVINNSNLHRWQTLTGDSVFIKTLTLLGDTQQIYLYPNGNRIIAIHSSNTLNTFATFTDSVRNYTMQILDPANSSVAGFWNGKVISVSKDHGVVQMPGILNFPADTFIFTRVDAKRLKYVDCYPWQPGDVLHEVSSYWSQMTFCSSTSTYNKTILSRTMINADSVVFTIKRVAHFVSNCPPANTMSTDTFTLGVGRLNSFIENAMPQQTIDSVRSYDMFLYASDCGKLRLVDHTINQFSIPVPGCVQGNDFEPMFYDNIYIDGVAGYYFYDFPSAYNNVTTGDFHVIYWNMNSSSCGTPLYLGTQEISETAISVWPNPVTDHLNFKFQDRSEYVFEIYDLAGKQIRAVTIDADTPAEVGDLSTGIYFGKICSRDGEVYTIRFVKE